MLRILRIIAALVLFLGITLYFVDFAGFLPMQFSWLERIQLVPALKSHSWIIIGCLLGATILLGRLYCSTLCPLGVLQDVINAVSKRIHAKKKFEYKKPVPFIRLVVLLLFLMGYLALFVGLISKSAVGTCKRISSYVSWVSLLFDPYSIYGRIACNVFKPIYQSGNNLYWYVCKLCGIKEVAGLPVYYVNAIPLSLAAVGVALGFLIVIGYLAWRNGRTYCNTICPVGAFLGLLSRISIFRVWIDKSKCGSCGLCARECKSSCIDSKGKVVDNSRCVDCFDCLSACHKDAIHYGICFGGKGKLITEIENKSEKTAEQSTAESVDGARREFVGALVGVTGLTVAAQALPSSAAEEESAATAAEEAASAPVAKAGVVPEGEDPEMFFTGKTPYVRKTPIAPPGAKSIGHLNAHCTACHLCVAKCPTNILKPATSEYGVKGFMQPHLDFARGFCNYDCTICGDVCPNHAIVPLTIEQKHKVQMGRVVFIEDNCVVKVKENSCGACSEHCPTQAVSMVPYKNGLTIPHVNPDICVGCGGCESICPVRPFRAIYVEGNEKQHDRAEYEEKKPEITEVDDFGF
ncbi:MAG: 4Fe-4S dicluster domain-containing protein [Thermoguttaceae bacterium]|nr:4Fe-4S dicluster domain-containing protein [Thermoguttaceae bacterium]